MKYCYKCKQHKQFIDFNKNKTKADGLQSTCKSCSNIRRKEYYLDNKEKEKDIKKIYQQNVKLWFQTYKKTLKCSICGDPRHYVLDFHHNGNKSDDVSRLVSNKSKQKVLNELEKCTVLCANCHRELHYIGTLV